MTFITSGLWVWAVIFVLSLLKLGKDWESRNSNSSGGGESLRFIGTFMWTIVAICVAPISFILFIIALIAR